ncbi:uncharacterized protein LOC117647543 isoform X2 [Thrips palmi]|uniref:Uncharacterized protein LOC117647543 isoform X2 n=1 Tax=Thrips palmi TaxID=161013 RepID=A0A6P8ZQ46_THRPL|nr:uncharacterized protein LOC117647543 isoform X2 [Thrips palmi]XP_034245218.1 uncharacterized protein LOC117647543 isoform X2 [Thrips palmi]XP_034245219.1 uncharacterized protein LOC117647543 isoform X2 [Thrips palmi]XP_034245220.1 uncharacterized protein LOC117647543 isoform X2 [Thrips palmi]XP_034245221.1 uncharacterized protein LOC117647543 isoform X2 [Thrips palmi]
MNIPDDSNMSESKGLKRAGPYMRGAANSFGFRRNKKSPDEKADLEQRNYSQEALFKEQHNVTTAIKASPSLVRSSSKDGAPNPAAPKTNRFGFRAPVSAGAAGRGLSNKVGDSFQSGVLATSTPKPGTRPNSSPANVAKKASPPVAAGRPSVRPAPPKTLAVAKHVPAAARAPGSQLPRPQFVGRAGKDAKTVANYGTRRMAPIATFDDEIGSSKESSMNEDSGLGSQLAGDTDTLHGMDVLDVSPRAGQRLRRAAAAQRPRRSLRSLRDEDDDPNVITEIVPIAKMVSRASLKSLTSLGGQSASPHLLSVRGSIKSASSDEFHTDSSLFRDYGEGLDDRTEAKVLIDRQMAEKRPMGGRYMKDYGPGEEQDEDWGQGEAMADNEWRDVVGSVVIDEDVSLSCEMKELKTAASCKADSSNLAELVAASAEHGLIEDESAPEDSLFSSSPASTSDDSPSKHSAHSAHSEGKEGQARRRVRTKKREGKDASRRSQDAKPKDSNKEADKATKEADEKKEGHPVSPEGSGTPSNSFSLSDGRDFLIDDEIGDQPQLTIHNKLDGHGDDSELASITESAASMTLRDSSHHQALPSGISRAMKQSRGLDSTGSNAPGAGADLSHRQDRQLSRDNTLRMSAARFGGSMDSLATNSIDSEDLMMDFEEDPADSTKRYRSITKSWGGSPVLFWPRPRKAKSLSVVDLEELKSIKTDCLANRARSQSCGTEDDVAADEKGEKDDALDGDNVLLELSSLIESITGASRESDGSTSLLARHSSVHTRSRPTAQANIQAGLNSSGPSSAPDSPRYSLGSSGAPSPLRPPRQLASSDSDESAMMRVDRGTYQHMYQDVVHIKTMLLKLKRVLQEAETLNPFESSLKNGLLHQLVHADDSGEDSEGRVRNPDEEVVDLKRQMVLMKQQMEEKDRTIQLMQVQMMKYERISDDVTENGQPADMCNAATQTERMRPVSAGPSLLQSLPSDSNGTPLVSLTDTWGRRSRTPASASSIGGSPAVENRAPSASRVPTVTSRSSRSVTPGHQRLGLSLAFTGDSPSSIPLVKGHHRKTGTAVDSVPNTRRPPVVTASLPRKAGTGMAATPKP